MSAFASAAENSISDFRADEPTPHDRFEDGEGVFRASETYARKFEGEQVDKGDYHGAATLIVKDHMAMEPDGSCGRVCSQSMDIQDKVVSLLYYVCTEIKTDFVRVYRAREEQVRSTIYPQNKM